MKPYSITSHSQESQILDGKKFKQRANSLLSPSLPRALQNERAHPPTSHEMAEIQPLLLYIGPPENDRSAPTLGVKHKPSQGHFGQHMKFTIGRPCIHQAFASSQCKHLDHAACRPLRSFPTHLDPISVTLNFRHQLCGSTGEPNGFVEKPPQTPQTTHDLHAKLQATSLSLPPHGPPTRSCLIP